MTDAAPEPDGSGDAPEPENSEDETRRKFREALERKRAREAGTIGAPGSKGAGKVHDAHGPARNRRSFRRKSG